MSTGENQQVSLDAAADMAIASEASNNTETTNTGTAGDAGAAGGDAAAGASPPAGGSAPGASGAGGAGLATPPAKPFELPGWAKRWQEPSRKAYEAMHGIEGARPHLDVLQKELEQTYGYLGQRDQQYAEWRRSTEPLLRAVAPYAERYALQGMTVEQGITQLFQVADLLQRDPDGAFGWLAPQFKPRDAAATLRGLAQAWGVADLAAAAGDGEWQDPSVLALVNPIRQELAQLKEQRMREQAEREAFQNQQYEQQRSALSQHLDALSQSKDAAGAQRFPHFDRVEQSMIRFLTAGFVQPSGDIEKDLQSAYELAVYHDRDLQKEMEQSRAAEARRKALEQADATTKDTQQAVGSSRNVAGSTAGARAPKRMSLDEAADAAVAAER